MSGSLTGPASSDAASVGRTLRRSRSSAAWSGSAPNGKLVACPLQSIGGATDLVAPVATQTRRPADVEIRVDLTLSNPAAPRLCRRRRFTSFRPGFSLPGRLSLWLPGATHGDHRRLRRPGQRSSLDGAGADPGHVGPADGVWSPPCAQARILPSGGAFGYEVPATSIAGSLGPGVSATLFTGRAGAARSLVLGCTRLRGSSGVLTLVGAGRARPRVRSFTWPRTSREEFDPAASAFGLAPRAGRHRPGVRRCRARSSRTCESSDLGTVDVARSLPV